MKISNGKKILHWLSKHKKAYQRMTILRNLFHFRLTIFDMIDIYILYIRSLVERSAVVWRSSITQDKRLEIERVQKVAIRIIMKVNYVNYEISLCITELPTLEERRDHLSFTFAKKCIKSEKTSHMFPFKRWNCLQHKTPWNLLCYKIQNNQTL